MILPLLLFAGSLIVLIYASNRFIGSAERIGLSFGISPFIIGVTIIAFGTSLPELATSIAAVLSGSSEIVVGNVIGSNITNVLLVLGITTVVCGEISFKRNLMNDDVPLLMGSAFLLYFVLYDLRFSFVEAILLLFALVTFLIYSIKNEADDENERVKVDWRTYFILLASGGAIYFGAKYTVYAVVQIAEILDISPSLVSLSILALGTSLPEVTVSIVACRRGLPGMAVGNILGSNIFNTYGIMAIPSFFGELVIPPGIISFSLPFMLAITVLFSLVCYSKKVSLWEALMLLIFYIFFIVELIRSSFVN